MYPYFFVMVTIFEEFLVGNWIGNSLYDHQRTNSGWIGIYWWTKGLIPKGAMLVHSSMDHSALSLQIALIRLNLSLMGSKGEMTSFNLKYFWSFQGFGFSAHSYAKMAKTAFLGSFNPHFLKKYTRWTTFESRFMFITKNLSKTFSYFHFPLAVRKLKFAD